MFRKARDLIARKWWGTLPAFVILLPLSYGLVWKVASPIGLVDQNGLLVKFFGTRAGSDVILSLLLALAIALALDMTIRWGQQSIEPFVKSYPYSQDPDFFRDVEGLIATSEHITLIAIGLSLIKQPHLLDVLLTRANNGRAIVTLCMANPYSPLVQERWIEEMQGVEPQFGIEGSRRALNSLVTRLERESISSNFRFVLFEHYPTFATLIFDREIFIYPYGFQLIGNFSPVFRFRSIDQSRETKFFLENADRVVESSVSAVSVVRSHVSNAADEDWTALMVCFVPAEHEDSYVFGTDVLGYDVINARVPEGVNAYRSVHAQVGLAEQFGFQLTISDPLYFASVSAERHILAILRALCLEFSNFEIELQDPTAEFRNGDGLVIRCLDRGGALEALHCELVSRIYRQAISSDFRGSGSKTHLPLTDPRKADLFIRHYGSPYVLSSFEPHFTLLSGLTQSPAKRRKTVQFMSKAFSDRVSNRKLSVESLCVMKRDMDSARWRIVERVPLKHHAW